MLCSCPQQHTHTHTHTKVSRFIQKNPSLRSLSKVDRGIVALAHNLEVEYHGTKHVEILIPKKKKNKAAKQNANGQQQQGKNEKTAAAEEKKESKAASTKVKKSKTGRIHTQTKPLNDTGVRLAMLKKIIPFNFDDFMTLNQTQCLVSFSLSLSIYILALWCKKFFHLLTLRLCFVTMALFRWRQVWQTNTNRYDGTY